MKLFDKAVLALIMMAAASAWAGVNDLPVTRVDGRLVHFYEVQPKETVYSLSNKLGITRDYLVECNPVVRDGLKAYMTLYFPVEASEGHRHTVTHTVEKGETIYGLGKRLGVSGDMLIRQNPHIADGLKAGQVVTVVFDDDIPVEQHSAKAAESDTAPAAQPDAATGRYVVREGETFYSIARSHGISVAMLEDANPEIGILKAGDTLVIPAIGDTVSASAPAVSDRDTVGPPSGAAVEEPYPAETVVAIEPAREDREVCIAVMLPFMLGQRVPDKTAQRYTEFYKGLLMAADTLRRPGRPVRIYAYDTAGSIDTLKSILAGHPELKETQVIVAPDNDAQLSALGHWGRDNGVAVLNVFSVKDDSYLTNPFMMQANMPTPPMTAEAVDAFLRRVPQHAVVILRRNGGAVDKSEFADMIRKAAADQGRLVYDVAYSDKLKESDLASLPAGGRYLFIPMSGRQAELNRVLPALIDLKEASVMPDDIRLGGYPEWISFRGETLTGMQALNTMVYTRFYDDADGIDSQRLDAGFNRWYGSKMANSLPRQGTLGFDTGCFLINALRRNGGDFSQPVTAYDGVQSGFDMVRVADGGGFVNRAAYIVTFKPAGLVEKTDL